MRRTTIVACILTAVLLAGCVGDSVDGGTPQPTISRTSMEIQPIDPGASLPATSDNPHPTEQPEDSFASSINVATVNRLFGPVSHYLNDGGSKQVYSFDAATRQDDDFYQGVVYFYLCAIEGQQDEGISLEITDSVYRITREDLQKLFESYFGSAFVAEIDGIFEGFLSDDDMYEFQMSDGPTYTAALISGGDDGDTTEVDVQTMADGEGGSGPAGAFQAVLRKDAASIFGYSIESYTFTPVE